VVQLSQNIINGLVASGTYLLIALGITIVFGLTRLINFAHGQLLIIGTFIAYTLTSRGYSFWWAILASTLGVAAIAWILERGIFRFTLKNPLNGLIVGLGLLQVGEACVAKIWGSDSVTVRPAFDGGLTVGVVTASASRLTALAITVCGTLLFLLLLRKTALGRRIEATQEDPLAAAHVGIPVGQMITAAFVVGSAAAGAAGAVLGTLFPLDAYQGGALILKGFAVALLGGLGNVVGAIVASLIYGTGETMVAGYWDPAWVPLFTFGIIIAILIVRPGGLFSAAGSHSSAGQFGEAPEPERLNAVPRPTRTAITVGLAAALVLAFNLLPTSRLQAVFVLAAIYAIEAYSIVPLYHNTGMLSAANGGMMGIGAYTAALLAIHFNVGFWAALVPAVLLSALAGMLVGYPVSRARGHYFVLLTFAFGSLIVVLLQNLKELTKGDNGLLVASPPDPIGPISFTSLSAMFYLCLGFALLTVGVVYAIRHSILGARLAAIRDNEPLARSLGLNVPFYKVLVFGISGALAGLGGVLFLYQQQVIVPDSFGVLASIQFVIMVVLGGRSFVGPAVGVLVLVLIPEFLGLAPIDKELVYGLVLVAVIVLLPRGIMPTIASTWSRLPPRRRPAGAQPRPIPTEQASLKREILGASKVEV
jgi:branched-chain amino acid transport system permease protein